VSNTGLDWLVAVVTVATLVCLIAFRIWDSRTYTEISIFMSRLSKDSPPKVLFQVVNKSKISLYLGEGQLLDEGGGRPIPIWDAKPGEVKPTFFKNYPIDVNILRRMLRDREYKSTASLKFVVRDGTGKRHEQSVIVRGIDDLREGLQVTAPDSPVPALVASAGASVPILFLDLAYLCTDTRCRSCSPTTGLLGGPLPRPNRIRLRPVEYRFPRRLSFSAIEYIETESYN
jgi:hypothetical protein